MKFHQNKSMKSLKMNVVDYTYLGSALCLSRKKSILINFLLNGKIVKKIVLFSFSFQFFSRLGFVLAEEVGDFGIFTNDGKIKRCFVIFISFAFTSTPSAISSSTISL